MLRKLYPLYCIPITFQKKGLFSQLDQDQQFATKIQSYIIGGNTKQQMSQEHIQEKVGDQKLQTENESEGMITLQGSLVNKLIKRVLKDKIITAQFKKQFSAALSLFILYTQNGQAKKKYTKQDILVFLQREGLGKIAEDLRKQKKCGGEEPVSRKKGGQAVVDQKP